MCARHSQPRVKTHRRAAAYVFFVSVAILVSIVGISSITVSRVNFLAAESLTDRGEARLYAQSAVEDALLAIYTDSNWRSTYAHDTWTSTKGFGNGAFAWKLVDEDNGDLLTDRSAPVRVHGKGMVGGSVWTYSVLVQPPAATKSSSLLSNGDMETGLETPWWTYGDCDLDMRQAAAVHSGLAGMNVKNRHWYDAGPRQTVAVERGVIYEANVWVKMKDYPEDALVELLIETDLGWEWNTIVQSRVGTTWTNLTGTVTPTWSGNMISAVIKVSTGAGLQEFYLDDVSFTKSSSAIGPIPGTARRETQ